MRPKAERFPEALAAAVADGVAVDWGAAGATADAANAELVRQLQVIAALRRRPGAARVLGKSWLRHAALAAFGIGVALAAAKVLLAFVGVLVLLVGSSMPMGAAPFAFNLTVFGVGGVLLIGGGGQDRRLQLLGGVYLTMASAFVGPFQASATRIVGVVVTALDLAAPESFFVLGLWLFAWAFPAEPFHRVTRRFAAVSLAITTLVVSLLFVATFLHEGLRVVGAGDLGLSDLLAAVDRHAPQSLYWPVLFGLALPAIPFLIAKARLESPERRRKVVWFLSSLAIGMAPMLVAVLATPFVPALRVPEHRQLVGGVVYLGLASIVPMTAYAVVVNHVMDWQFVVKTALRYALARYAIRAAILLPLGYLAFDLFLHRGLTILQYLEIQRPSGLLALSGVGLVALTFRPQLVAAVDRWFHREPLDPAEALARLEHRFRQSEHLRQICTALSEELSRAMPAAPVHVMLLADDGASLISLDGTVPSIARQAVLVELLSSTRSELLLEPDSAIAPLLPDPEQEWLNEAGTRMLSPLVSSSGDLLGLVSVGAGVDELPYTPRHTALVTAMGSRAALQLENRSLRQRQTAPLPSTASYGGAVGWRDEPAVWCPNCTRTWSPGTQRCRCGTSTKPAVLPLFVNGKFRLQRALGAGGTGVVYLATDLALDRKVALKTLPPVRREYAARLRREARAMAAVRHPNLATIFGAEEWRETPLLVVEYLEGGTLQDLLTRGALAPGEALDLGIVLADALDRVHGTGVLHRDIKPSNIGFASDGTPKLLDFGLAAMLDSSKAPGPTASVVPVGADELGPWPGDPSASATLTATQQVVGTPLYLSPEALAGSAPQESFDLWSLNMVLYEAVAGRHPFGGRAVADVVAAIQTEAVPDVRDLQSGCPAFMAAYLAGALSREPSVRPASAAALRTELRALRRRLDLGL